MTPRNLCVVVLGVFLVALLVSCGGGGSSSSQPAQNPVPNVVSISPNSATTASPAFTLTVNGTGFVNGSTVLWNGSARSTTFVSSNQLQAAIAATDVASAGTASVAVSTPAPGGGSSSSLSFAINNAAPTVTSVVPASAVSGGAAFTVTVNGNGFVNGSTVLWNGSVRSTTFVSSNQLQAAIAATDVASAGTASVAVSTPTPGGGTSSSISFAINNPAPTVTSTVPASTVAGGAAFSLTVNGTGFVNGSSIIWNGTVKATTYVSSTQLQAQITTTDIADGSTVAIAVSTPSPGGGTSAAFSFAVNNPAPTVASLSPSPITQNNQGMPLIVTGSGFVPSSKITWNGTTRTTTFNSGSQLQTTISASDVAALGSVSIGVHNPAPGGGDATPTNLQVQNAAPVATSMSPSSAAVGSGAFTLTVNGSGFVPASEILWNGISRTTTFVSNTQLQMNVSASDISAVGTATVAVYTPAPGGGTSSSMSFPISAVPTPVLNSSSPTNAYINSPDTTIAVYGSGFLPGATVQFNGLDLSTTTVSSGLVYAVIPAAQLTSLGTGTITAHNAGQGAALSNGIQFQILPNPVPTLSGIYPNAGPINTAVAVTLSGTGFSTQSTVSVNGAAVPSTWVSPTQITCQIPASSLALPGNASITVTTPAPGGGTATPLLFTTYLAIANNDIVYNAQDGLLYASVPATGIGNGGNSVAGIDPVTGTVVRQIWVGSKPNKLALSTDSTQLFVGLDGAGAVAQVDLNKGAVVNQFSLGGGPGVYNPPHTANYLAAVPGSPNSVAVAAQGSFQGGTGVTIYDSGAPRAKSWSGGWGPLSFGSSSSTLYTVNGQSIEQLTVDSTGITGIAALNTASGSANFMQYDNGQLYLSTGQVFNASTGTLLGTFYSSASTAAAGPIVSDSTLGRAFVGVTNYSSSGQLLAFDENTFISAGSIPISGVGTQGYPTNFQKIVRWGPNGIALSAAASAFTSVNQIFIFQLPLVKDLSAWPADLAVTLNAPSSATTGANTSWLATITNNGPNQAQGAVLTMNLDPSLIINSIVPAQGSCGTGPEFSCDLGSLASGASATVTVNATPSNAGTLAAVAAISSTSYDPTTTNNQAGASTVVSGSLYGVPPLISSISPNFVQAGTSDFTLTLTGAGFNAESTVYLGAIALPTSYISATQLAATVSASDIAIYGWAPVTVTNPAPGGGVSQALPLTVYAIVDAPASGLLFDPYSRLLYATIPGTATSMTGNSVVTIDPVTGTLGTPVFVGSQPTVMAETDDGNYLYIGLSGANSLAQFDLLHQTLTATIPLSVTQSGSTSSVAATWLAAMPGSDSTLAVNMASTWGNFGIFDISGNAGTFRPNLSGIYEGVNPVFADASHVYAFDSQTSGAEFYRYSVDTNGLTLTDGTTLNGMGGFSGSIQLANGRVYGVGGGIINPSTTPPSQVATLPLFDFYGSGVGGQGAAIAADPSLQKEFLMMANTAGTWAYGLVRYDLATYNPEALIDMPTSTFGITAKIKMMRFGQDGLAILCSAATGGTNQPVVLLLRGPFVAPQLLTTNPVAALQSSSSNSITHGSGNTLLTLTGSNLLPGVAVTWNGSYRTTTWVSSTHVTVAIPASDLASAGTASLVATNPGASASNVLTITIN